MNYVINIIICLIPIWVLLGYLFIRRKVIFRTKLYFLFLIVCSYLSYPVFTFIAFELVDIYLSWQSYHCGWGYGLAKPDEYCLYSEPLPGPFYVETLNFTVFILALITQVILLYYLDNYRKKKLSVVCEK